MNMRISKDDGRVTLLRCLMTAVNQQFVHIIALRHLGDQARAARIYEVDKIDFVTVMRLIDDLVRQEPGFALPNGTLRPGADLANLLRAELDIEARIEERLGRCDRDDPISSSVATARTGYRQWLENELRQIGESGSAEASGSAVLDARFSLLIAVMEQTLIHAFLHWHAGRANLADRAWSTSGAAMLELTGLVRSVAGSGEMAKSLALVEMRNARTSDEAAEADLEMVKECRTILASAVRDCFTDRHTESAGSTMTFFDAVAGWQGDGRHPSFNLSTEVFHDFGNTRRKFGLVD